MSRVDVSVLVAGLLRASIWTVAFALAYRERRFLAAFVFAGAAINAVILTLYSSNTGIVSHGVWVGAIYMATPIVAGIVLAFLLGTRRYRRSDHWTL